MAFTTATLVYLVNPTGVLTAAELAASMQAWGLATIPGSRMELWGCAFETAVGAVVGGQAQLTITFDISSATFKARWPSIGAGGSAGPFPEAFTGALRAVVNQPVLASTPTFS